MFLNTEMIYSVVISLKKLKCYSYIQYYQSIFYHFILLGVAGGLKPIPAERGSVHPEQVAGLLQGNMYRQTTTNTHITVNTRRGYI